jgi:hypothetical protein
VSALSHQAKAGVLPVEKPKPREKRPNRLQRGKPLRRVLVMTAGDKRAKRTVDERRVLWNRAIRGTVCVACQKRPAVEAHHIIREQVLRRYATEHGYDFEDVRFDPRNRLGLCKHCHGEHHSGKARLSHDLLWRFARWVYTFAEEIGLEWTLDREYSAPVFARRSASSQQQEETTPCL